MTEQISAVIQRSILLAAMALPLTVVGEPAQAHGPVFSAGPEISWKGAREVKLGFHIEQATGAGKKERKREFFAGLEYGITPFWDVSVELPYRWLDEDGADRDDIGDLVLGTKYQFWRQDLPGAQRGASILFQAELPTGDDELEPRPRVGGDFLGGLAVGHEGRRWYGFADFRYRLNTERDTGLDPGDKVFLDVVGGIRPVLTEYDEPDTVLMLELNWEYSGRDDLNGLDLADTGGWELFISPVLWLTYRQYAARAGVQIPIAETLNGSQPTSDYRSLVELVYHF